MNTFIFDNDGTLLDSEKIYLKSWEAVAKKYNFKFTIEAKKRINGKNFFETTDIIAEMFNFEHDIAHIINMEMNQMRTEMINNYEGSLYKPYIKELLDYLKNKKYKLGMATASSKERLDILYGREKEDIRKYFDVIVTGDEVKACKPNPQIFNTTMEMLESKPEDTFIIEDSNTGIRAARLSGATAVLVVDIDDSDEIKEDANLVFNDFKEFIEYLEENNI
ncbi:HAD family phosphatase [Helcococcus bovis]|uniref:HAD family hydrolase n=1 Tax=Helcococcus bovis TaxID=3153252 RepID=UPI0038B836C0